MSRAPFFIAPHVRVVSIAAVDINGIIGDGVKMPWHPGMDRHDMLRFVRVTTIPGTLTLMGANTYLGLPVALHGRRLAVLTGDSARAIKIATENDRRRSRFAIDFSSGRVPTGVVSPEYVNIIGSASEINGLMYSCECYRLCVAGGGDVYRQTIAHSRHVLLTIMPLDVGKTSKAPSATVYFPSLKFDGGRFPDGMTVAAEYSPHGALLLTIDIPSSHVRKPEYQADDMTREEIVELIAMGLKIDKTDAAESLADAIKPGDKSCAGTKGW